MSPQELTIMLDQWARSHAPEYGLSIVGIEVTILGLADNEKVDESGARGGFFPFSAATVTVKQNMTLAEAKEWVALGSSITSLIGFRARTSDFERLFLKLCHDIWMTKDLALRGRVVVIE